jgi:hypothetical protein
LARLPKSMPEFAITLPIAPEIALDISVWISWAIRPESCE